MNRATLAVVCFIAGLIVFPIVIIGYLKWGNPPVAVADSPLPFEKQITGNLLNARVHTNVQTSPIPLSTENIVSGAQVYQHECAFCHGLPLHPSEEGENMFPSAPQLWKPHGHGDVVGVSDDPVGETFWKVKNGIRLTGMPSYEKILNQDQMWQVSLLLSVANKPLPPAAEAALSKP